MLVPIVTVKHTIDLQYVAVSIIALELVPGAVETEDDSFAPAERAISVATLNAHGSIVTRYLGYLHGTLDVSRLFTMWGMDESTMQKKDQVGRGLLGRLHV